MDGAPAKDRKPLPSISRYHPSSRGQSEMEKSRLNLCTAEAIHTEELSTVCGHHVASRAGQWRPHFLECVARSSKQFIRVWPG